LSSALVLAGVSQPDNEERSRTSAQGLQEVISEQAAIHAAPGRHVDAGDLSRVV
jgi:hypothetical protein